MATPAEAFGPGAEVVPAVDRRQRYAEVLSELVGGQDFGSRSIVEAIL